MPVAKYHLSPLRYPGGKSRIAGHLANLIQNQHPLGQQELSVWFEPFAGGLGAGLKLLDDGVVEQVWFCEANQALAAFWQQTISDPEPMIQVLEEQVGQDVSMEDYQRWLNVLAEPHRCSQVLLAVSALVVNRCSRSGLINPKASPIGGKNQDGKYTVNARWNLPRTIKQLRSISAYGDSIKYMGSDGITQIEALASSGVEDEIFIFADPPYVGAGNRLYEKGMAEKDHKALARALQGCPSHWVATYDDSPLVHGMYADYQRISFSMRHTANVSKIGQEIMIFGPKTTPYKENN